MILNIKHQTTYNFYSSVPRLVQSLKLYPSNCKNQKVIKLAKKVKKQSNVYKRQLKRCKNTLTTKKYIIF